MAKATTGNPSAGGAPSERFIDQQGGYLKTGGGDLEHTQNFTYQTSGEYHLQKENSFNMAFYFTLQALGERIRLASLWQLYKVNSVTLTLYSVSADTDYSISLAPWTRPTYSRNNPDKTPALMHVDARSLVGVESRYIKKQIQHNEDYTTNTPHQMLKVQCDTPMFAMPTYGTAAQTTHEGATMRDGFIPTYTMRGTDNTRWYLFWGTLQAYQPPANRKDVYIAKINIIKKVNITFKGVRWDRYMLQFPQTPKQHFKKILPKDDLHDNKQRKRGRHPPKVGNYIIWKPVDEKPRLQDTSKLYSVVKQRRTEQGEH
jgi:hypothetical protein